MSDESRIIRPGASLTKGGKYNISRDEAVSIAVQIGQQVYDHVAQEHKKSIELLVEDFNEKFAHIANITAYNIRDLQARSFGFAVAYDLKRAGRWILEWYWAARYAIGWLPKDDGVVGGIEPDQMYEDFTPEPQNVGAPTEQPSRAAGDGITDDTEAVRAGAAISRSTNVIREASGVQSGAGKDRSSRGSVVTERGSDPGVVVEAGVRGREAEEPQSQSSEGRDQAERIDGRQREAEQGRDDGPWPDKGV
jgi:hypothetical protein